MSTAILPAPARVLPAIPGSAHKSHIWRDAAGVLQKHEIELPVDKATDQINGLVWACPVEGCTIGEWAIPQDTAPKQTFCKDHGDRLIAMPPLDGSAADPIPGARQRMLAKIQRHLADKREATAKKIRASIEVQVAEARGGLRTLAGEMRGHLPSIAVTAVLEVGVLYTVDLVSALESVAIGTALAAWGTVIGYVLAVRAQKIWHKLRRREQLQGRGLDKARLRSLYAGKAILGCGLLFGALGTLDGLCGLDLTSGWQSGLVAALTVGLAWVVNRDHWNRLWAERRRIREEAARKRFEAAEREARRLMEEAERLRQQAQTHEQIAEVADLDPDNPEHQGELMRIEWERISQLRTAEMGFPKIRQTQIVPARTREVFAPDPEDPKKKVIRIGWEYHGTCEPGALVASGAAAPIVAAKEWLVSVLFEGRYDASQISVIDKPGNQQNTFLVMITERARLGEAVPWRAEDAVEIADGGNLRRGYLGRSLLGEDLTEVLYHRGTPFGGLVTGTTGGGKGGFATRYLLNLLQAQIFPVLFDPKELVDYGDFVGLFPMGFTKRHRRMLLEFLVLERQRRQKVTSLNPKTNRYGARIAGESKWQHRHEDGSIDKLLVGGDGIERNIGLGEPIGTVWDEFHDLVKQPQFILDFTNHVRFQRLAGIGALLLSQGGGLEDWGNSVLRDLANGTSLTNFRSGEMQARMSGNRNGGYSTADLPPVPGMCLRQGVDAPAGGVPLRAAFISRDADAEDTIYTTLWGKGVEREMQIEDPMTWISVETIELMKQTGVWDLWMLARNGGLDALLADTAEDEEDEEPGTAVAMPRGKDVVPAGKPLSVKEILLAILYTTPGIDRDGIQASPAWAQAGRAVPDESTISRYANQLDPTSGGKRPLPDGMDQKLDRGIGSRSWRLTAAGQPLGAAAAARLAGLAPPVPAGYLNPATNKPTPIAIAEMAAQRNAEMEAYLAEEARRLARA